MKSAESLAKNAVPAQGYGVQIGLLLATLVLIAGWVALFQPQRLGLACSSLGRCSLWEMIGLEVSFYSMLTIAALLGTALRNTLRLVGGELGRFDPRMVLNEAEAGILIAFGFALLYWAGAVVVTGDVPSIDVKNFRRVALTMSTLGFAASFLLNEAANILSKRILGLLKK